MKPTLDASDRLRVTAVGDMMFDRRLQSPRIFHHQLSLSTCIPGLAPQGIPYVNTEASRRWVQSGSIDIDAIEVTSHASTSQALDLPAAAKTFDYPFAAVRDELRRADLVFGNLECPLSKRGRRARNDACYSADPRFAGALAAAPFHVLSFANNHCMDFGADAFRDTLEVLREHGIALIGAGTTLETARCPAVFERAGTRIAFLAYNMVGPDEVFACDSECGVVPLNAMMVEEDVGRIRNQVDLVVVSAHWGAELVPEPWPWLVSFAHDMVDCGVDLVLGHHPHVPGSVEIYRNRPIFYSLGNFCFGHSHAPWTNNMIVSVVIEERRLRFAELIPIAGTYQPRLLAGAECEAFAARMLELSSPFRTTMSVTGGRIRVPIA